MPVGGGDVRAAVWSRLHSRQESVQVLRAVQPYPRLQPGRALNHDVPARARGAGDVTAMLNLQILRRCA